MKKGVKKIEIDEDDDEEDEPNKISGRPPYRLKIRTPGQKAADSLTKFVGSWHYIFILAAFLLIWIIINTSLILAEKSFDPYPYILLNLVIAAIAAIEVPIILMSQNRQEQRHMAREEYDYAVDIKSEKEIREIREQLNRIEEKLKR